MSEKSYVPSGAILLCDKGVLPLPLTVTSAPTADILGTNVATEFDKIPGVNIKPFGLCAVTGSPCTPVPTFWDPVKDDVLVHGARPLLEDSKLRCGKGGCISVFLSMSAANAALAALGQVNNAIDAVGDGVINTVGNAVQQGFDSADAQLKQLPAPLSNYLREEMGKAEGVLQGAGSMVSGLWDLSKWGRNMEMKAANAVVHAIQNPAETAQALSDGAQRGWSAVTNADNWRKAAETAAYYSPSAVGERAGVWLSDPANRERAWNATKSAYDKAQTYMADPRNRGKVQGRVLFEVGFALLTAGTGEAAQVSKVGEATNLLEKGAELANVAEKGEGALQVGKVLTGAEEAGAKTLGREGAEAAESQAAKNLESVEGQAPKNKCTCEGDPVDVASGAMLFDAVDVELPGPVPLVWERTWYSTSERNGPLGLGWHHRYDLALWADADGRTHLRLADGRLTSFAPLTADNDYRVFNRAEQLELRLSETGPEVHSVADRLTYRFASTPGAAKDAPRVLVAVDNAHGQGLRFDYGKSGQLCCITDSAGRRVEVQTDPAGRILALHLPLPGGGSGTFAAAQYAYDTAGHLVAITDAEGHVMRLAYRDGLVTAKTFRNGVTFYFEYDAQRRCTRTWGDGNLVNRRFFYEPGRTLVVTDEPAARQEYFHRAGLVTRHVDAVGAVREWVYNRYGELEMARDPLGHAALYDYDAQGRLVGTTFPDGATEQTSYDDSGRPTRTQDANGGTWQWQYDAAGRLQARTDPAGAATRYGYDEHHRLAEITDALGHTTHLRYDTQHNLAHVVAPDSSIRSRTYDALGRPVALTDARGHTQRRRYDRLGQLVAAHEPDGTARQRRYDGEGNLVYAADGTQEVELAYTPLGQLARRRQAGHDIEFEYDLDGRLTALRNELGETYRFGLDAAGHVVEEVGFDGLTRRYARDAAGRVVRVDRPAGRTTAYTYDPTGRITEVLYNGAERATYRYRPGGALVEAANEAATVQFERDALGRVVREVQNGHAVESTYDALGRRVGLSSSLGAAVRIERDALGRVKRTEAGTWHSEVARDAEGLELHRELSGGVRTSWQRDALGRPTSQRISVGGNPLDALARQRRYHWEGDDRLAAIEDTLVGTTHFAYDARGFLTGARYADGAEELRLADAVGNLFRSHGRADRKYGKGGQLREANGVRYRYDEEGNLVRKTAADGRTWHYRWDGAGQLAAVELPSGYAVAFAYDALGRRVRKRYRGQATRWVWDGDVPLHEWAELEVGPGAGSVGEALTWLFEEGSFAPAAKLSADEACSVVADHLGTPLALYDAKGRKTWQAQLDGCGQVRTGKGRPEDCPFRYPGQYEDAETGLYYNRFRYYDPETGGYISQDPIRLFGGEAFYAYVPDPNRAADPYGLKPCFLTAAGQQYAEDIIQRHGGKFVKEGYYQMPSRRAARQAASEIAGDLGSKGAAEYPGARVVTRKPDFRGGPRTWAQSEGRIGVRNAEDTAGWRDDILGHDFGQGDVVGSHVNAWNHSKGVLSNLHLLY